MTHSNFPSLPLRLYLSAFILFFTPTTRAADPALDRPTLRCLGVHWVVPAAAADATVSLEYRKAGDADWRKGAPLFRVEPGKHLAENFGSKLDVPDGSTLFAGSVVDLAEGTAYDIRLTLAQPAREP